MITHPLRFGMVAFDKGGVEVSEDLAKAAKRAGHKVHRAFPEEREGMKEHEEKLAFSDVLVIGGPSSNHPEVEIEAARRVQSIAAEEKRKLLTVVLADTFYSPNRAGAKEFASEVDIAFVASPDEINAVKAFGYPSVTHIAPPSHWRHKYAGVIEGRAMRPQRKKWGTDGRSAALDDQDRVIVLVGGKNLPHVFNDTIIGVRSAAEALGLPVVLDIRAHPRERGRDADDPVGFQEAINVREKLLSTGWIIENDRRSTARAIGSADAMIAAGAGGPTDSIGAALAGVRMGYVRTDEVEAELTRQIGRPRWPIAEMGFMEEVTHTDTTSMTTLLRSLFDVKHAFRKPRAFRPDWTGKNVKNILASIEQAYAAKRSPGL